MSASSTPTLRAGDLDTLRARHDDSVRTAQRLRDTAYADAQLYGRIVSILETLPTHAARLRELADDLYAMTADLELGPGVRARLRAIAAVADALEGR